MAQIDGARQQDTHDQNAEALQAALAQRQVTLQGQPQGSSGVPSHQNSRSGRQTNRKFYTSVRLLPKSVVYRGLYQSGRPNLLTLQDFFVLQPLRTWLVPRRGVGLAWNLRHLALT